MSDLAPDGGNEIPVQRQRLTVRAIMLRQSKVLLARIAPTAAGGGTWTLPGGGVDHGEHPGDALLREVYEETGLVVRIGPLLDVFSRHFTGRAPSGVLEDFHAVHLIYLAEAVDASTEPRVIEVDGTTDAVAWVDMSKVLEEGLPTADVVRFALEVNRLRSTL